MDLEQILKEVPTIGGDKAPAAVEKTEQVEREPVERASETVEKVERQEQPSNRSARKEHRDREQAAQGRVRDPETGQFAPKADEKAKAEVKPEAKAEVKIEAKPEAAPKQELTEKEKGFLKAAEEERRKRQQLERELAEARGQKPQPEGEKKTFWDDPEAALARHQQEVRGMITNERLVISEEMARSKYPDFDEKIDTFEELMKETPILREQMMRSPNPAEFAYKTGKTHKALKDAGSIDELTAKVERETRVKVEAEMREKMEREKGDLRRVAEELPKSLSNVSGVSPSSRPVFSGPKPLEDILKS